MRLDTFEEGILSPIFLIKAPTSMADTDFQMLQANSNRLVENLDIAPTFADLLGAELNNDLSYEGYSLIGKIPEGRVAYSTSTNDWRHWTTATIAVSRGKERLTCDSTSLCRLSTTKGGQTVSRRSAKSDDELFMLAEKDPILRRALGQIYRNYYR